MQDVIPVDGREPVSLQELRAGIHHLDARERGCGQVIVGGEAAPVGVRQVGHAALGDDNRDSAAQAIFIDGTDVYIAGYEGAGAKYWKNGVPVSVPFATVAKAVFVDGADVYIAGNIGKRARYWKNGKPVRLTQSALNLDSYSLYTRSGFVPRCAFQDMFIPVPEGGLKTALPGAECVRPAVAEDVPAMAALEMEVSGITRRPVTGSMVSRRRKRAVSLDGIRGSLEID